MSVTRLSFPYGQAITWYSPEHLTQSPPLALKDWLLDTGSLTQKLKSHCDQFSVIVLGEAHLPPFVGEFTTQETVWVREVLLCLDGTPWVFARTLVPSEIIENQHQRFLELGTRPLGELLFSEGNFTPGEIEISQFYPDGALAELINAQDQDASQALWGRRRYFSHNSKQLSVSEIFLPASQRRITQEQLK
ncbi:chorismate lyase [Shewanella sp. AS1]|uniref:chorismate--pyruvate lyase family protein n=1 Tax=Shewanella sp. AS1 TaxID=2907626 RepID=UPI001F02146C|nr:chorismate lyase [Shewanella sp. AS1]MCE9680540.1 chorismate lyase [Shewanella sp. AS1]